jgi:hypothetical protein
MTARDADELRRRLTSLARAADRIANHVGDLHSLGWEPTVTDTEKVAGGAPDHTPKSGHPRARQLFNRIAAEAAQMEAETIGLERTMMGLFFAGSINPEPSRGSMISRTDFDRLRQRQRQRPDTPARLVDQPPHPGAKR